MNTFLRKLLPMVLIPGGVVLLDAAPPPPHAVRSHRDGSRVSIDLSFGLPLPRGHVRVRVGNHPYVYHRGMFYRETPRGLVVVRAPRGAVVPELPPRHVRVVIAGEIYYRIDGIYYRPSPGGYMVVDVPVATESGTTVSDSGAAANVEDSGYESVWLGDVEYLFKDGAFFRKTPEGLIWQEAPLGAITKTLPRDAESVWHDEIEYFEIDGIFLRKTADGYKIVEAPWKAKHDTSPNDKSAAGAESQDT